MIDVTTQSCKECLFCRDNKCRREPPKLSGGGVGAWPIIAETDWCGMYYPKSGLPQQGRIAVPVQPPQTIRIPK